MDTTERIQCQECKKYYNKYSWGYERGECTECGEKSRDYEKNAKRNFANKEKDKNEGRVTTLNAFADIFLFLGIILAIIIWAAMGIKQGKYSWEKEANPIGILYGFVVLFGSFLNWVVLRVICVIANNIIQIRRNSNKILKDKEAKN